ncbi:MAG: hypothetical protein ACHQQQ_04820 [Bacteroidota bacterium]
MNYFEELRKSNSGYFRYLIPVIVLAALSLYTYGSIDYANPAYSTWELHDYSRMAAASPHLDLSVRQPFIYRLLGPFLAGLLPVPVGLGFHLLTSFSAVLLAVLFFLYLSRSINDPAIACLMTCVFILNKYLFGFPVWNYFQLDDILSFIEIILLLWNMERQRWLLYGVVLFLGSLTRETPMLMIPVTLVFLIEKKIIRTDWRLFLLSIIPAIGSTIMMRVLIVPTEGNTIWDAFAMYSGKTFSPETWFRLLINSFIPLSLIPVLYYKRTVEYLRRHVYAFVFMLLVIVSTFFGLNIERLMAPASVIFYSLTGLIIAEEIKNNKALIWIIMVCAVLSNLHHAYARFPLPREATIALSIASLILVTAAVVFYRFRNQEIPTMIM